MGYEALDWVERLDIPTTPKFVLYYLARRAKKDGTEAFPGLAKIIKATSLNRRTVQRSLQWLQHAQFIEQTTDGGGGRGRRSTYRLDLAKGGNDDAMAEPKGRLSRQERAALTTGKGGTDDTKGGTDDAAIRKGRTIEGPIGRAVEGGDPTTTGKNQQWEAPGWFAPMVVLEGYKKRDHSKSATSVYTYCVEVADVDPAELVNRFCNDWPWLRVHFGRKNPVAMLRNTVEVQASKLVREGRSRPEKQTSGRADGWSIPTDGRQPSGHQGEETSGRAAGWDNQPGRA